MKKILIYTGLVVILFVIGLVTSNGFIGLSISFLYLSRLNVEVSSINSQFNQSLFFGLILGTIPLIQLLIHKMNRNVPGPKYKFLISTCIIVLTGLVSWTIRIFQINYDIKKKNSLDVGKEIYQTMAMDNMNFNLYILTGFIIGGILSLQIWKRLQGENTSTRKANPSKVKVQK